MSFFCEKSRQGKLLGWRSATKLASFQNQPPHGSQIHQFVSQSLQITKNRIDPQGEPKGTSQRESKGIKRKPRGSQGTFKHLFLLVRRFRNERNEVVSIKG